MSRRRGNRERRRPEEEDHGQESTLPVPPAVPSLSKAVLRLFADRLSAPFSTRAYLVIRALSSYIQSLLPTGSFAGLMRQRLSAWLMATFAQIWPSIDPVSNTVKRLYYEFQIVSGTNEHEWLQHWLNNRPSRNKEHRRVLVTTGEKKVLAGNAFADEPAEVRAIRKDLGYKGLPHADTSQWFTYRGGAFQAHKRKLRDVGVDRDGRPLRLDDRDPDDLYIKLFATTRAPFLYLLAEAKKKYEDNNPPVIEISHFQGLGWGPRSTRQKRSFDDVILTTENRNKLEYLVEDFLRSGNWYLNKGLSWKRGILLHGPPGCGKTSTIVGLASKYDLKVFHLSLNHAGLDDETLADLIRSVGQRSIVCLEDCDSWAKAHNRRLAEKAAFMNGHMSSFGASDIPPPPPPPVPHSGQPSSDNSPPPPSPNPPSDGRPHPFPPGFVPPPPSPAPESRLSLAGLLNVLDGVEEQKGILYILTTNDPDALDSAMIRPGRVDAILELARATRKQAEDLFNVFYKPYDEETPEYDLAKVPSWAKTFAREVNHREFSVAALQNFLLEHRTDPAAAIAAMPEWVREKRFPHLFATPIPPVTIAPTRAPSPGRSDADTVASAESDDDLTHGHDKPVPFASEEADSEASQKDDTENDETHDDDNEDEDGIADGTAAEDDGEASDDTAAGRLE